MPCLNKELFLIINCYMQLGVTLAILEVSDISTLSDVALKWIGTIVNRNEIREQKENNAIESLMNSLNDTANYMKQVLNDSASKSD